MSWFLYLGLRGRAGQNGTWDSTGSARTWFHLCHEGLCLPLLRSTLCEHWSWQEGCWWRGKGKCQHSWRCHKTATCSLLPIPWQCPHPGTFTKPSGFAEAFALQPLLGFSRSCGEVKLGMVSYWTWYKRAGCLIVLGKATDVCLKLGFLQRQEKQLRKPLSLWLVLCLVFPGPDGKETSW